MSMFDGMSENEIRDEIIKRFLDENSDKREIQDITGRANLVAKYYELEAKKESEEVVETDFEDVKTVDIEYLKAGNPLASFTPEVERDSEGWQDYVMKQFRESELKDGAPNVMGLRRVAKKLLGNITRDTVHTVVCPNKDNGMMAVVEAQISIRPPFGDVEEYSDVADTSPYNCGEPYINHSTSTAASKAASRALRKALGLQGILSAEEITPPDLPKMEVVKFNTSSSQPIAYMQIISLDKLCQRFNINLVKFVNAGKKHYNNINEIDFETADQMIQHFNDKKEIFKNDENLIGYDKNWRASFSPGEAND